MRRTLALRTGGLVLLLALASAASAQDASSTPPRDITRLGGSTAFYRPPLTTAASVTRMGRNPRVVSQIRAVLHQADAPDVAEHIVAALTGATAVSKVGLCVNASPADGVVVECDVQPGQPLLWMAYRPQGGTSLGVLKHIRWAGKASFPAFLFRISDGDSTYTFLLPKVCGNLTLMSVRTAPVAVAAPVVLLAPAPPPVEAPPPPSMPPPPPPAPAAVSVSESAAPIAVAARATPFFIDVLGGKDRRVRPIGDRTTTDGSPVRANAGASGTEFAQCSPLVGIKIGVAKRFESNWELAGAVGFANSLVRADDKVRQHEVLIDVEANRYMDAGAFIGTGLSLWDITHRDTFTPAWMAHVGLPLGAHPTHPVHVLVEGRVFFDHLNDVRNNYQFWAGVRVHL